MPEVFFPPLYTQTWVLAETAAPVTGGILQASVPPTTPLTGLSLCFHLEFIPAAAPMFTPMVILPAEP